MVTTIIGGIFMDIKGFSYGPFSPAGTNVGNVIYSSGGVCRNVCEDFANQGEAVRFVSMTDESAIGQMAKQALKRENVDLKHLLTCEGGLGIWMAILDDHGELVGSVSKQPNFAPLEAYIREKGDEIIAAADAVVLEIDMNEAIAGMVLDFAERHGKPVYCIVSNMGVILKRRDYLHKVCCYISNDVEASRLFGEDIREYPIETLLDILPARAEKAGLTRMIVTLGGRGCVYYDRERGIKGHYPARPAHMVDSTGAGDAFFSGTVMALSRGMRLEDAVKVGTKLAAATIECAESSCGYIDRLFVLED